MHEVQRNETQQTEECGVSPTPPDSSGTGDGGGYFLFIGAFVMFCVVLSYLFPEFNVNNGRGIGGLALVIVFVLTAVFRLLVWGGRTVGWMSRSTLGRSALGVLGLFVVAMAVPGTRDAIVGGLRGEPLYSFVPASIWVERLKDPVTQDETAAQLRDGGKSAVPVLVWMLTYGDPDQIWTFSGMYGSGITYGTADNDLHALAANLLGDIGPDAQPAVAPLLTFARGSHNFATAKDEPNLSTVFDKNAGESQSREHSQAQAEVAAEWAVEQIADDRSVKLLLECATHPSYRTRRLVARVLRKVSHPSSEVTAALNELAKDAEELVRLEASR